MQLDLSLISDSLAHHGADRADDERALQILALIEAGVRFERIDRKFSLADGTALKMWFDICEACGDFIAVH
jgi:hypothetical protein